MMGKNVSHTKYILTDKNNKEYITTNLYKFCLKHKICKQNLYQVLNNTRKHANNFTIRSFK